MTVTAWYDIDFPEVIAERKRFFQETDTYHMLSADVRDVNFPALVPSSEYTIIVMEGISMYMKPKELQALLQRLTSHFKNVRILLDFYTWKLWQQIQYNNQEVFLHF